MTYANPENRCDKDMLLRLDETSHRKLNDLARIKGVPTGVLVRLYTISLLDQVEQIGLSPINNLLSGQYSLDMQDSA